MAIYQLHEQEEREKFTETFDPTHSSSEDKKGQFFSTLVTRLCFLLLLAGDALWLVYNVMVFLLAVSLCLVTGGKKLIFKKMLAKSALNMRRSIVCGLALFIGLFSPPFGIMVACTYFLMYDKAGMEEVVPAPLQAQFKDIFHTET